MNVNPSLRPRLIAEGLRLASPRTAFLLGVLYVALVVAALPLSVLARGLTLGFLLALGWMLPFAAVGLLVAARQPRNAIGWLMVALALSFMLSIDGSAYSVAAFRLGHHLPLARVAVVLASGWVGLGLLPLPILLFPDGRLPSARWRWPFRLYVVLVAGFVAAVGFGDLGAFTDRRVKVDSSGELANVSGNGGWFKVVSGLMLVAVVALGCSFVVQKVIAYRRSVGERRQQLKWLMSGGGICITGVIASIALNSSHSPLLVVVENIATFSIAALPIGIGVGILKYRLYEIDRLVSRTISYLIITGLLAGVFVAIVVVATDVLPFSSPVAVAASTLAAAALFNPLRKRVQHLVDRRFNRARYDAQAIVETFTAHLREAVDLETVRNELLATVDGAVQPSHASLWIKPAR